MIRFIILFLFTVSIKCQSQSFEGMITYEINHEYFDSSTKDKKLMPSKLEYYISGELARIDQHTKIGVQTSIIDTLLKKHILLIQLMDKKFGILIENEINNTEKTTYLSDSDTILDFFCNKAIINEDKSSSTVFFTKEISNAYNNNFKNLKGFPIYYEIISQDFISSYKASSVIKKPIDPMMFEIDNQTSIYTMKDFQDLMSQ